MIVSIYNNIRDNTNKQVIGVMEVLQNIKNGAYEDYVYPVRNEPDKKQRQKAKELVPYVTVSGTFSKRNNQGLIKHSGFLAIDFDDVTDYGDAFNILINDPYTFAAFRSISGKGLCAIVKINGDKHLDSFLGLEAYYFQHYQLICDPSCKDLSRPRYLSYDPDIFINEDSEIFKTYIKKQTKQEQKEFSKFNHGLHNDEKFELILSRVNFDITQNYHEWIALGMAIESEYKQLGIDYFKQISSYHSDFDPELTARKYRTFSSAGNGGITIKTFYWLLKKHGIDISFEKEQKVYKVIESMANDGKSINEILTEIKRQNLPEISEQNINSIVIEQEKTKEKSEKIPPLDINKVEAFIRKRYLIKKNEVTRFYEMHGKQLEQADLNTIYLDVKKVFPRASKDLIESIIYSTYTESYNPILNYLQSLKWDGKDYITLLSKSITSNTGTDEFREYGLSKWLLGIIESIMTGKPNILCLILAGKQNTGKSTFFTKLLPKELNRYFATSQLDRGKDDEILMCQSLIIFDDEFSGKSKQDAKHMKRILSAPSFTLREPYGRQNVTLRRIATLCGTCNELDVLNDPTGNRRFIVYEVNGKFNYELYNSVPKEQLFAQLMQFFKNGANSDLDGEFIQQLEQISEDFTEVSIESELLLEHFSNVESPFKVLQFKTNTAIKVTLEARSNQRISSKKLGTALRQHNFQKIKRNGISGYMVCDKS